MQEIRSRDIVLKNIRQALIKKNDNPFDTTDFSSPVYQPLNESLDIQFAQEFSKIAGQFIYCENEKSLTQNLKLLIEEHKWQSLYCFDTTIKELLNAAQIAFHDNYTHFNEIEAGITGCESLIARLGSILVSSATLSGRKMNVFPPAHIVIAYRSQLVPDIKDALEALSKKYGKNLPSLISMIAGPSRTADIEKTLVMGAHGPKEIYLFLVDKDAEAS